MDPILKDLVSKLLVRDPEARIGSSIFGENGYDVLKKHSFFDGFSFEDLFHSKAPQFTSHLESRQPSSANKSLNDDWDNSNSNFQLENCFCSGNSPHEKSDSVCIERKTEREKNEEKEIRSALARSSGAHFEFSGSSYSASRSNTFVQSTKALFSGTVKVTVYMFFSQAFTMVLYSNKQIILFQRGEAKVLFPSLSFILPFLVWE